MNETNNQEIFNEAESTAEETVTAPSAEEAGFADVIGNSQENEPDNEPSEKEKKPKFRFSILQTVLISAICIVLTFMITGVAVINAMNARFEGIFEIMNGKLEEYENEAENMVLGNKITDEQRKRLFALLLELDATVNAYEFNEMDYLAITNSVLEAYAAAIGDNYAEYYTKEEFDAMMESMQGQNQGVGINIVYDPETGLITVINVMPNSPALEAGVLPGDKIYAVGIGEKKELVSVIGYTAAVLKLQGLKGTLAEFTVIRDGKEIEFSIMRDEYVNQSVTWHEYAPDKSVAVVRILNFDAMTPSQFKQAMSEVQAKGIKKVVFDVRSNPGGNLNAIVEVLDLILPEGPIIRIVDKTGKTVQQISSGASCEYSDMQFAVLANENTASAAELFTSALMDYERATVVGTVTYGKGSMQSTISLSGGTGVKVTTYHYLPPYAESYEGIGIKPDVEVELDEALQNKNIFLIGDEEDNQLGEAVKTFK